ncbi:MAG: DnaJ domain-containing protein [Acidimicrobiia bacterium]|nr:DnaJ domain-containing protein [Acidimicrobiia bacterium]
MTPTSPYQVLGVSPAASDAEVERRYRHLLRVNHPDLLHDADQRTLTDATERTRTINAAMAQIRADRRRAAGGVRQDSCTGERRRARSARRCVPDEAACPLCPAIFGDLTSFQRHLVERHRIDRLYRRRAPRRSVLGSLVRGLRLVPISMLLAITVVVFIGAGITWAMAPMLGICAVLWAQTTPHFRNGRH